MKKELLVGLAWGGSIVLVALGASLAHRQAIIDNDTVLRVVAMNGLMVAYYGNIAPKAVAPNAYARQVARFAGWSQVLGGVAYAGLWAFAPIPVASTVGTGALAASVAATLSYCLWLRAPAS